MLNQLLNFLRDPDAPLWHGYLFAVVMFFGAVVDTILRSQHEFLISKLMVKMKAAMIASIYRKVMVYINRTDNLFREPLLNFSLSF